MPGFSPKVPLTPDPIDGWLLNKNLFEVIQQNLKMLILTNRGEYTMNSNFGCNVRKYIFQPNLPSTYREIEAEIRSQVGIYMPYLKMSKINFTGPQDSEHVGDHQVNAQIEYYVKSLGKLDKLSITFFKPQGAAGDLFGDFEML